MLLKDVIIPNRFFKYDLRDVTFILPVRLTDKYRVKLFDYGIKHLVDKFHTNIVIGEYDEKSKLNPKEYLSYDATFEVYFTPTKEREFHKTRYANDLLDKVKTSITCLLDYDTIIWMESLVSASQKIRDGYDMCLPYSMLLKLDSKETKKFMEMGIENYDGISITVDLFSYYFGGCVFFKTGSLRNAGGFNENIILGGEDVEIAVRMQKLGAVCRLGGAGFHLYHPTEKWWSKKYYQKSIDEISKALDMNREEIAEYSQKLNTLVVL